MASFTKSFREYVKENHREYHVRVKTITSLDDENMEMMERVLQKYVPIDIDGPTKTIIQKHPLDFQDIRNAEVYIVDITTELPISSYVLQQELKLALGIPEKFIVVRSTNDPLEIETQRMNSDDEISMQAMEKGLSPEARLSTNSAYDVDEQGELEEPAYGDEYNKNFLDILKKVSEERIKFAAKPDTPELDEGGSVVDSHPEQDSTDFNELHDGPKPVYKSYTDSLKNMRTQKKTENSRLSTSGNYDDDEIKRSKKYAEYGETGKVSTVTIQNKRKGIRVND